MIEKITKIIIRARQFHRRFVKIVFEIIIHLTENFGDVLLVLHSFYNKYQFFHCLEDGQLKAEMLAIEKWWWFIIMTYFH